MGTNGKWSSIRISAGFCALCLGELDPKGIAKRMIRFADDAKLSLHLTLRSPLKRQMKMLNRPRGRGLDKKSNTKHIKKETSIINEQGGQSLNRPEQDVLRAAAACLLENERAQS